MKPSNILLTVIAIFIFVSFIGANLALRAEFRGIDQKDPFGAYNKQILKPFKYVKLEGKEIGLTEFQQGKDFEIRAITDWKYLDWKVEADTLMINFKRDWTRQKNGPEFSFRSSTSVYIFAPQLSGISSNNIDSRVANWKGTDLDINQEGGSILLTGSSIENLNASVSSGGYLKIDKNNRLEKTDIEVKDTSMLVVQKNVFKSLMVVADSTAMVSLQGGLVKRVNQSKD